jgi:MazG family protein
MHDIHSLLKIMQQLRDPDGGCPWDRDQTYESLVPYTLEEAYEVADAIARKDIEDMRDELGDLLFQVVFYAQIAREQGEFDFNDIANAISEKLIRRHPHVFGDENVKDADEQTRLWEEHKLAERQKKADSENRSHSVLEGISISLPALMRAQKLQRRAARVGFDWPEIAPVMDKVQEELQECRDAIKEKESYEAIQEEIGDLLFSCVNLARHADIDAETALRDANEKFTGRFNRIEAALAEQGKTVNEASLEEMDALWEKCKMGVLNG